MAFIEIPSHENVLFIIIMVVGYISMWSLVEQAGKIKLSWEIATVFVVYMFMAGLLIIQASMPKTADPKEQAARLLDIVTLMAPYALFGLALTAITLLRFIGYLYKSVKKARSSKQPADEKCEHNSVHTQQE
jgi:hypothetical protein